MPVLDGDGRLVGMVSEADLLAHRMAHDPRRHLRRDGDQPDPPRTVGEVMTSPVVAMGVDADAADIADLMLQYNVRSVPIVDGASVVGIVSRRDLLRTLVRDDGTIAAEIRSRLDTYGGRPGRWPVQVQDGVVSLGGPFGDQTECRVSAPCTPGKRMRDKVPKARGRCRHPRSPSRPRSAAGAGRDEAGG